MADRSFTTTAPSRAMADVIHANDPTRKSGAFRLHWPPTRGNRPALLLGADIGQADVLYSLLGWDWNNLGDFEKLGVAKAEQEADARVIRQPLQRRRVAELYLEVVRQS